MKTPVYYLIGILCLMFTTAGLQAQDILWTQAPGSIRSDVLEDVWVDDAGFSHVTGKFSDSLDLGDTILLAAGFSDVFTAKYDPNGNLVWAHREGGPAEEVGVEISLDALGNVYVAGRFQDTAIFDGAPYASKGNVDIFVIKYDKDGNFVWVETVGGTRDDRCRGLVTDSLGHCYITGRFRNVALFDTFQLTAVGLEDVFVSKLDLDGSVMWVESFGGPKLDFGEAITVDLNGNLYVTGSYFQGIVFPDTTYVATGDEETFLAKYDNNGVYQWAKSFGGPTRDYGEDVNCDEFGNVWLAGTYSDEAYYGDDTLYGVGDLDILLVKVSPEGEVIWSFGAGAPGGSSDVAWASDYDGRGNGILSGWFRGDMTFGDTILQGSPTYSIFVGKVNAAGKATWAMKLGNTSSEDIGRGVSCDGAGNAIVAGSYQGSGIYGTDTLTALGQFDMILSKVAAGQDDCAFSHAVVGDPSACSPVDGTYSVPVTLYHYFAPDSGDLNIQGQVFPIGGNRQDMVISGLIPTGGPETLTAFFTADSLCRLDVPKAYNSPIPCDPCVITDVSVDSLKACKFLTNRYEVRLEIAYAFEPDTGFLVVQGDSFPITGSPQFIDLDRLYSDGDSVDVAVYFTEEAYCLYNAPSLYKAPDPCNSCSIVGAVVDSISACDPLTGTYTAYARFNIQAWPDSGGLVVNGQVFPVSTTPLAVALTGLPSDGLPVDLDARFEGDTACQLFVPNAFTAAPSCDTCIIGAVAFSSFGACSPVDDTYTVDVDVTYASPPSGDSLLVNGQLFAATGSPQTVTLIGLPADGLPVDVSADFRADTLCTFSALAVFIAPDSCTDCALTGVVVDSIINDCEPFTNTFQVNLDIAFLNAPGSGNLLVNGTPFAIGASPQLVNLANLPANGLATDINVSFSDEPACSLDLPGLFFAPTACDTCARPVNLGAALDSATPTTVLVSWDPVPNATAYQVRGRKAASMATGLVFAFTNGKVVNNLQAGKTYAWTVRSYCPFDTSEFVAESFFTLFSPRLENPVGSLGDRLSLYPNPATVQSNLVYNATLAGKARLVVYDAMGRLRYAESIVVTEGTNLLPIHIADWADGMYQIGLEQDGQKGSVQLMLGRP